MNKPGVGRDLGHRRCPTGSLAQPSAVRSPRPRDILRRADCRLGTDGRPTRGGEEFGMESALLALSFITAFGATKAIANFVAGWFADRDGRRTLLLIGWVVDAPWVWWRLHRTQGGSDSRFPVRRLLGRSGAKPRAMTMRTAGLLSRGFPLPRRLTTSHRDAPPRGHRANLDCGPHRECRECPHGKQRWSLGGRPGPFHGVRHLSVT